MAFRQYDFAFFFPRLSPELQTVVLTGSGGTVGTAFKRAWFGIKNDPQYKGRKNLIPFQVNVQPHEPNNG